MNCKMPTLCFYHRHKYLRCEINEMNTRGKLFSLLCKDRDLSDIVMLLSTSSLDDVSCMLMLILLFVKINTCRAIC